ncbi:hypothetical protein D3C81_2110720 [compost metagenome]
MMTNQLCAGAGQGPAGLKKAPLPLPVPVKDLMHPHDLVCIHQFVSGQAGSDSEVA